MFCVWGVDHTMSACWGAGHCHPLRPVQSLEGEGSFFLSIVYWWAPFFFFLKAPFLPHATRTWGRPAGEKRWLWWAATCWRDGLKLAFTSLCPCQYHHAPSPSVCVSSGTYKATDCLCRVTGHSPLSWWVGMEKSHSFLCLVSSAVFCMSSC